MRTFHVCSTLVVFKWLDGHTGQKSFQESHLNCWRNPEWTTFTAVCSVTWPLNASEAGSDFAFSFDADLTTFVLPGLPSSHAN